VLIPKVRLIGSRNCWAHDVEAINSNEISPLRTAYSLHPPFEKYLMSRYLDHKIRAPLANLRKMRVHFTAIGGSAMHNLAIALHRKGYRVTGSDDEIVDPSKSRLQKEGILPAHIGWDENNIHEDLDAVILGMHARIDNPELLKAKALNLPVFSYPEYLYEQTKNKTRVVIGGSHGKTTITSMILHVLNICHFDHDYMVGAQLDGFDCMVKLSDDAKVAIFEGDEYLSSPIDRRPKFHLYFPNIALLSGIAWDHINVFPTFENYVDQFRIFISLIEQNGVLTYSAEDPALLELAKEVRADIKLLPYSTHPHRNNDGIIHLITNEGEVPVKIFGSHNLQNLSGALEVCRSLGISDSDFYSSISDFSGASRRMEKIAEHGSFAAYRDFAHSPSKLKATVKALKEKDPNHFLTACFELHTFSSLNKTFLDQYKDSMVDADRAIVFYSPDTIAHKKLPEISMEDVLNAFNRADIEVYTSSSDLEKALAKVGSVKSNLLLMSSGNFHGMNVVELMKNII